MRLMSRRALPAAAAVLVLGVSACGSSDDSTHGSMPAGGGTSASTSAETATGLEADVKFAQMMIPHHDQAVEMADLALQNDTASTEVKALAGQIKAAQDPEIQTMKAWLSQWGAQESNGPMDHGSGGMMSEQDMSTLMGASGSDFNQMWLEMMIEHHQGAITMAQDVLATTADPDVEKLATAVVQGQEKEIATMQGMLG
ncbi:DUF305 domain-containing protein [Fodinibacter luteus]|uniref:DUF305 domain-containing protein n=2 Tax=Fodinibacter luteus TaxID=552064 RepID=A0ABP8KKJ1_9MICO